MYNSYSSSCSTASKRETGYSTDTMLSPNIEINTKSNKSRQDLQFVAAICENLPKKQDKVARGWGL